MSVMLRKKVQSVIHQKKKKTVITCFKDVIISTFQESEIGTEREQEQSEYESATEDNEVRQLTSQKVKPYPSCPTRIGHCRIDIQMKDIVCNSKTL